MAKFDIFDKSLTLETPAEISDATGGTVSKTTKAAKGEGDLLKTGLYLNKAVHEKLREIAFHERKRVHDLFMEGVDLMLTKRLYPSTSELANKQKAS